MKCTAHGAAVVASRAATGPLRSVGIFVPRLPRFAFHLSYARALSRLSSSASLAPQPPASFSRETSALVAEVLPGHENDAVRELSSALIARDWKKEELDRAADTLRAEREELRSMPDAALSDYAMEAAYGAGSLLARPAYPGAPDSGADSPAVSSSRSVVIAGIGVDHAKLVSAASAIIDLPHSAADAKVLRPAADYRGGRVVVCSEDCNPQLQGVTANLAHVSLLFKGVAAASRDLAAALTLQTVMGGGSAFSAGGPGKGMHSVLFRTLLSLSWIESAAFTVQPLGSSGVIGINAACEPDRADSVVAEMADQLSKASHFVNEWDLTRAKNALKSSVFTALEKAHVQCDDLGRQLLLTGRYDEPLEFARRVDAVTAEDVEALLQRSLGSPPSLAAIVPRQHVGRLPSLERLSKLLAAKLASEKQQSAWRSD